MAFWSKFFSRGTRIVYPGLPNLVFEPGETRDNPLPFSRLRDKKIKDRLREADIIIAIDSKDAENQALIHGRTKLDESRKNPSGIKWLFFAVDFKKSSQTDALVRAVESEKGVLDVEIVDKSEQVQNSEGVSISPADSYLDLTNKIKADPSNDDLIKEYASYLERMADWQMEIIFLIDGIKQKHSAIKIHSFLGKLSQYGSARIGEFAKDHLNRILPK